MFKAAKPLLLHLPLRSPRPPARQPLLPREGRKEGDTSPPSQGEADPLLRDSADPCQVAWQNFLPTVVTWKRREKMSAPGLWMPSGMRQGPGAGRGSARPPWCSRCSRCACTKSSFPSALPVRTKSFRLQAQPRQQQDKQGSSPPIPVPTAPACIRARPRESWWGGGQKEGEQPGLNPCSP